MRHEIARRIREALKLKDVMEFYGVSFNARGFALCPFHAEKTASLSVKNERYKCFGCGAYGDAIDFVMRYHGLKFPQALVKLDHDFRLGIVAGRGPAYRQRLQEAENQRIDEAKKRFEEDIHREYLTLCQARSVLYGRYLKGEAWLGDLIGRLDLLLDDFTGEEARAWRTVMRM